MKNTMDHKVKTGIFILIGLLLLFAGIFLIGKQQQLFNTTISIRAGFKNVAGLQAGNLVRLAGITVGSVSSVTLRNDTTVEVILTLDAETQKFIKKDATANIGSDGLMGDKIIQLSSGSSPTAIANNDSIAGVSPLDMDIITRRMDGISKHAFIITDNLAEIIYKINNGKGSLGTLLNSEEFSNKLEQTLHSTEQTVKSIKKGADGFSENMEAAKDNFLFRGYFRRKERERKQDSINRVKLENKKKKSKY